MSFEKAQMHGHQAELESKRLWESDGAGASLEVSKWACTAAMSAETSGRRREKLDGPGLEKKCCLEGLGGLCGVEGCEDPSGGAAADPEGWGTRTGF